MREPMRNHDDLDLLLDSALATYADSAAEPGLEERVLAGIAAGASEDHPTAVASRGRRWLPWAIALPLAASLLWVAIPKTTAPIRPGPPLPRQAQQSQPAQVPAQNSVLESALSAGTSKPARHRANVVRSEPGSELAQAARQPKLDVFPTPEPLTAQEQALAVYARSTPLPGIRALIKAQDSEEQRFLLAASSYPKTEPPVEGRN